MACSDHKELDYTSIYSRGLDDSEESDGEGGLGCLSRQVVRPPGHSGKAKRGHLCFDAAFECGNLGRADHVTALEYDLYLRPDTCRPRARFWFNFTVENVRQDQRVIFNIVNFGKARTLFAGDMTPLVRSTSRPKWQRIPRRLQFRHRSAAHRGRVVLSLAFAFDREEDVYHFTAAPPYSYSRLQRHLALWEKKAKGLATRETIALTTQKRKVDLITIGDWSPKVAAEPPREPPPKARAADGKRRVVLIIARAHGGEPPASFICQGFLDFMVSSSESAVALRNGIVFQVVPMLNPDGVFLGNQRADLLGADLNRSWRARTPLAHPALVALADRVDKLKAEKSVQLDFILDLHADVSHEGVFVRGNSYDDVYRFERHAVLPKFLSARVEAWRADGCLYNADAAAAGTARRTLPATPAAAAPAAPTAAAAAAVDGYSLLASLGGRRLRDKGPYMHYTEDAYARIGRSVAKALCDYYRHVGVLPPREGRGRRRERRGRRRKRRRFSDRGRSVSSSRERERVAVRARVMSPPLPPPAPRPPPPPRGLRAGPRAAPHAALVDVPSLLPAVTGVPAVRTPRLAVVDLSSYIRAPRPPPRLRPAPRPRLARAPRPAHAHYHSEEDTQESDY